MSEAQYKIRVPNAANREVVRQSLVEDEDFRIPKIKLGNDDPPRFTIPAPTQDDPDNIISNKGFAAVILVAKQNFFRDKNNPEAEPKERRALYLVRAGKIDPSTNKVDPNTGSYFPDLLYASPSSLRPWKEFCALLSTKFPNMKHPAVPKGTQYFHVLVWISGKRVKTEKFTWNKLEFTPLRVLDEKEVAWVNEIIPMVEGCIKTYESNEALDAAEDDVVYGGAKTVDHAEPEVVHSAATIASVSQSDEDEAPASAKKQRQPKPQPAPEPEAPKQAPKPVAQDDDEDDSGSAPAAPEAPKQTPSTDDEADAPPPPARRRTVTMDDDDE